MRTLFITGHRVHPPLGGAALRNWQNINIASRFGPVATFTVLAEEEGQLTVPDVVAVSREHSFDRFETRSLIGWLQRKSWPLRARGLPRADRLFDRKGIEALGEILAEFRPTVIVLEELWLWRYLDEVRRLFNGDLDLVYDAHNIESTLRTAIVMSVGDGRADLRNWRQALRNRLYLRAVEAVERHLVSQVDQVWVCSAHDRGELLLRHNRSSPVAVIPNGIDLAEFASVPPLVRKPDGRFSALFVGSFGYAPNARAAEFLIKEVFPHVWSRYPGCRLMLVGRDPTEGIKELSSKDSRVLLTGAVPDVRPYLAETDVVVAPLREGSGTRLKILESFAARRPLVATPKGVEGLAVEDSVHALIRDTPLAFANAIVRLIESEDFGIDMAARAHELVANRYAWTTIANDFKDALASLRAGV